MNDGTRDPSKTNRAGKAETRHHALRGLEAAAEIRVDRWGVPHIKAASRSDAFFVQGFNAARDRLWQIDIWRKRGLGQLAADFGPGYLAQDRAARLFLYRGDMTAEWNAYGVSDAKETAERFAAGVNEFIDLTEDDPALLSPEFALSGTKPARWDAADVVRIRSHARVRNLEVEVPRARVLAHGTLEQDLARRGVDLGHTPFVPNDVDFAAIGDDVLTSIFSQPHLRPSARSGWPPRLPTSTSGAPPTTSATSSRTSARKAPTTGPSHRRTPRPDGRSSPATRIAPTSIRPCATSRTCVHRGST
jgi:hypothetical protein